MFRIQKIHNNIMDKYYKNIYNTFLLNNNNDNILIINQNYFNPLTYYSHHLKKYNINLYILFNSINNIEKLRDEINHEECNNLIHYELVSLEQIITEYQNIKFNKIILLHVQTISYLDKILKIAQFFKVNLYIYISLSTKKKAYYKNTFRKLIKNISSSEIGNVFDYDNVFELLNSNQHFTIDCINMIDNNHFITYGSHKTYLFVMKYKMT